MSEQPTGTVATLTADFAQQQIDSPGSRVIRRFLRHRLAMFGLVILIIMASAAIFAAIMAPYDPAALNLIDFRQAPVPSIY